MLWGFCVFRKENMIVVAPGAVVGEMTKTQNVARQDFLGGLHRRIVAATDGDMSCLQLDTRWPVYAAEGGPLDSMLAEQAGTLCGPKPERPNLPFGENVEGIPIGGTVGGNTMISGRDLLAMLLVWPLSDTGDRGWCVCIVCPQLHFVTTVKVLVLQHYRYQRVACTVSVKKPTQL